MMELFQHIDSAASLVGLLAKALMVLVLWKLRFLSQHWSMMAGFVSSILGLLLGIYYNLFQLIQFIPDNVSYVIYEFLSPSIEWWLYIEIADIAAYSVTLLCLARFLWKDMPAHKQDHAEPGMPPH